MIRSTARRPHRPFYLVLALIAVASVLAAACARARGLRVAGMRVDAGSGVSGPGGAESAPAASAGQPPDQSVGQSADSALIVRTGSLDLEVKDFDTALAKARTAIVGMGGYIGQSQMALKGDQPYGSVTYRVPVARWDDAVAALKALSSKVVSEQSQAVEVTKSVVDLEAHIANLQATEQQLLTIMSKAVKISDILDVQGQLTTVRGDIEQLVAERDGLKDQAAYGTLTVGWSVPVVAAVTVAQQGFDPAKIVDSAVAQLVQLGQGLLTAGIWLAIVGLPVLIGGLLVLGVLFLIARWLGRRRRAPLGPDTGAAAV
ncbi:MAG: DUF4349 domain-containing protein [Candidatus Limnocylindrales bacterium]